MTPQLASEIGSALESSKSEVLDAANVSESLAARKPSPDRWSILECMEHLVRVENGFLDRLQPRATAASLDPEKESTLAARMRDRSERRQAPEPAIPTGRYATLAAALDDFRAARVRAGRFLGGHGDDLMSWGALHPRWGELSARELLLLIANHSRRHAAQMRETLEVLSMTPQPQTEVADALAVSERELLDAANVPESVATTKPAEGRWSVIDCVEHVAFVEQAFLSRLQPAAGDAPPPNAEKEAGVMVRALNRENKFQAPEAIHPKGKFATVAEALDEFKAVRARTAKFAEDNAANLYSMSITHPVLGLLNGKEALLLIAGHSRRHALQMREAAAAVSAK